MASRFICAHCKKPYRRSKNRTDGRKFCSIRCYWSGQKISVAEIWKRDHGICHLCDKWCSLEEASRDHVKPRHYGGKTTWQNIRLAHRDCNSRRGHMEIDDFILILEMREMAQGKKRFKFEK